MSDNISRAELSTLLERLRAQIAQTEQEVEDAKEAVTQGARTTNGMTRDFHALIRGYHDVLVTHTPKLAELRGQEQELQRIIWAAEDTAGGNDNA